MQELKLEKIQENNWKQGVIIENLLKEHIISETQFYNHIKDSDLLILYTQDCDLINVSLEKEPFVEFFCVKKVESINHDFAFGKNPRKIHLEMDDGSIYEFDINKRVKIDRKLTKINRDFPVIKRLFFSLHPEREIDQTENYSLGIYVLLAGLSFESDENVKDFIIPKLEELFSTERIDLTEVACVFEDEMTIYDLGIFKVWDKEYITLQNNLPN